ncbi:MAG: PEP-CTERM sorting domain-containing protein [Burkholderiales bacterium]
MKFETCVSAIAGACLLGTAPLASAIDVAYTDFADVSALQLNDRAATVGNSVTDDQGRKVLRLTDNYSQKGSAFLKTAVSLADDLSFSSYFQFRMTQGDGFVESGEGSVKGADGIVFALNTVNNYTGLAGEGLGYRGFWFGAGIEFDTFNNGSHVDADGNHVGIDLDGSVNSVIARKVTSGLFNNGQIWSAWVDYDGVADTLQVRVAQGAAATRPDDAFIEYVVDLDAKALGDDVYFGFTASTGSLRNHQDILRWEFSTKPVAPPVPEPASIALLGLGGLVLAARARRRRA